MRRKDRERDTDFALEVVRTADYGVVSGSDYSIPLSLALEGNRLYGHGAKAGMKWDYFKEGSQVRVVFVNHVEVPHPIKGEDLVEYKESGQRPPLSLSKIFTTNFASAIVSGTFHEIKEEAQAKEALRILCRKYNNEEEMAFFDQAFEMSKKVTRTFYIEIQSLEAKEKR